MGNPSELVKLQALIGKAQQHDRDREEAARQHITDHEANLDAERTDKAAAEHA